jgi:hypothetical protein
MLQPHRDKTVVHRTETKSGPEVGCSLYATDRIPRAMNDDRIARLERLVATLTVRVNGLEAEIIGLAVPVTESECSSPPSTALSVEPYVTGAIDMMKQHSIAMSNLHNATREAMRNNAQEQMRTRLAEAQARAERTVMERADLQGPVRSGD